jgi:RNA polymerase sigma factor (sigma-70 family)
MTESRVVERLVDVWSALCHPRAVVDASVLSMTSVVLGDEWALGLLRAVPGDRVTATAQTVAAEDVDELVVRLYREEALSLVRLARLFVDDRNAAEDLVQEAFIRLARAASRIDDRTKAAAYLRSIVLNLARDHNRRGLVSLRHHLPFDDRVAGADDDLELREDQREVLDALRELPLQQRNCVALRHLEERGIAEIAAVLGISENSVKTHLKRGMAALTRQLGEAE